MSTTHTAPTNAVRAIPAPIDAASGGSDSSGEQHQLVGEREVDPGQRDRGHERSGEPRVRPILAGSRHAICHQGARQRLQSHRRRDSRSLGAFSALGLANGASARSRRPSGVADGRLDHASGPVHGALAAPLRRRVHGPAAGHRPLRVRVGPGGDQAGLHRQPGRPARGRGQPRARARAGQPLAAAARRARPPAPPAADAAVVPRRAAARLRRADAGDRAGGGRVVAARAPDADAAAHAVDHAGDHPPRGLRARASPSGCG